MTSKIGILCEKPSQARNFQAALTDGKKSGTFEGEEFVIASARGHLYEMVDPDMMCSDKALSARYRRWSLDTLPWNENDFTWKKTPIKGSTDLLKGIRSALSGCDEIICCTDFDPSGEGFLLFAEIFVGLGLKPKRLSRAYFVDESEKEIQKAIRNRETISNLYMHREYRMADYRSKWDYLSMQFSRIATLAAGNRAVIRQGRLKSVMVKLSGDQLKAYKEYKKVTRYQVKFKDENGVVYADPNGMIYDTKDEAPVAEYHDSSVIRDKQERKHTAPPKLLDLASLSATLAPNGYAAKEVQDTYQALYEAKIVSYPRTEDKFISPEQFTELRANAGRIAAVVGVDARLLTHAEPRTGFIKTGGSHGANRPGPVVPGSLAELEKYGRSAPAIYEILARNSLAMFAEDYEYDAYVGHVQDFPDFVGKAQVPVYAGWKAVYSDEAEETAEEEDKDAGKGLGDEAAPYVAEVINKRPPRPTMKWLMKQLEKYDVGTGATRTSTYADVTNQKTKYPLLKDTKGRIDMAQCGEISYRLLQGTMIADVKVTKDLQQEMKDVADGVLDPAEGLRRVQGMVTSDADVMLKNARSLPQATATGTSGNSSAAASYQKEKYSGTWHGKTINFSREWGGHTFTDEECKILLAGEEVEITGLKRKDGKGTYGVSGKLAKQTYKGHSYYGFKVTSFL